MQRFTANVLNHWRDSEDALPIGTLENRPPPTPLRVSLGITTPSRELARMRKTPELYFEWQIDAAEHAREQELRALDLFEWDCGSCGNFVTTRSLSDRCPICGAA